MLALVVLSGRPALATETLAVRFRGFVFTEIDLPTVDPNFGQTMGGTHWLGITAARVQCATRDVAGLYALLVHRAVHPPSTASIHPVV